MIVDYEEMNDHTLIHVFQKGKHYTEEFTPYFYKPSNNGKYRDIYYKKNRRFKRVEATFPHQIPKMRTRDSYEADIKFHQRWMWDRIKNINTQYSICTLDIENSTENMPDDKNKANKGHSQMYSIVMKFHYPWATEDNYTVLLYLQPRGKTFDFHLEKVDEIIFFRRERKFLNSILEFVRKFDPDLLVGWGIENYDMPYLYYRMKLLGIEPRFGRQNRIMKIHGGKYTSIDIWGRRVIDAQVLYRIKRYGRGVRSWKLTYISRLENLDQPKEKLEGKGSKRFEQNWRNNPRAFATYNLYDVLSTEEIFLQDFPFFLEMQRLTLLDIEDLYSQNAITRAMFMLITKRYRDKNEVIPRVLESETYRPKGADVSDPSKGYFEDVQIPDFRSYYPYIIKTFNMSPETVGGNCKLYNGHSFDLDHTGVLVEAVEMMLEGRFKYKRKRNEYPKGSESWKEYDRMQNARKRIADGMFGAVKNKWFNMTSMPVAESILWFGRQGIQKAKTVANDYGLKVVRSDTDGLATVGNRVQEFVDDFDLDDYIDEFCYNEYPEMEIILEEGDYCPKFYSTHEKKRYFYYDDSGSLKQKGFFKSDLPEFAESFQREIFTAILDREGKYPHDVDKRGKQEFMKAPLEKIGFRSGFPGRKDFRKASDYAERHLGVKFLPFDRPYVFKIKSTGFKPHTDLLAVNDPGDIPSSFVIDREAMWDNLVGKGLGATLSSQRTDSAVVQW